MNLYTSSNEAITKKFLKEGYIVFDIENLKILEKLKEDCVDKVDTLLKLKSKKNILDNFHKFVSDKNLNSKRMEIYSYLNSKKYFIENYYKLAKNHLNEICGNELAVQRKVNLSIQMPNDDSSLLPIHSDVWSGCSPYEVVLWVPLVDAYDTKSMFIFPKTINDQVYKNFKNVKNSDQLFKKYKSKIKFLNVKFGQGLIFAHSIIHGNTINETNETRWSFNCRFKSLMSPYYKKDLAETFVPLNIKPATIFGLKYVHPKI